MATVLVIDDVEHVRLLLRSLLETDGHTVTEAGTGGEALARMRETQFDLIVTDVIMPDIDGIAVIKEARDVCPSARIIAISGGSADLSANLSLKMGEMFGADAVLFKPFDNKDFLQSVNRLLSQHPFAWHDA
ncbi:MAG: response regulator [Rhodospirillaceae bacterium]|nr:response regulator [Rhodospirillaceae bacterium]